MRLRCARTVPITYVPLVVAAWISVGFPLAILTYLVRVVSTMETSGARGARVIGRHVPATHETLVPVVEHLLLVGQIPLKDRTSGKKDLPHGRSYNLFKFEDDDKAEHHLGFPSHG